MTTPAAILRPHAEDAYAAELAALGAADDRPRPPGWRLSPWSVVTYLLGGEAAVCHTVMAAAERRVKMQPDLVMLVDPQSIRRAAPDLRKIGIEECALERIAVALLLAGAEILLPARSEELL